MFAGERAAPEQLLEGRVRISHVAVEADERDGVGGAIRERLPAPQLVCLCADGRDELLALFFHFDAPGHVSNGEHDLARARAREEGLEMAGSLG